MSSILLPLRAEARSGWRGWLAITLLVGLLLGAATAVAAGAHRTGSTADRAVAEQRTPDIFMAPDFTVNGELLDFDTLARLPEVKEALRIHLLSGSVSGEPRGFQVVPDVLVDGHRVHVVAGRLPVGPDEAAVSFLGRERWGTAVGDYVEATFDTGLTARLRITGVLADIGDFSSDAEPTYFVREALYDRHQDRLTPARLFAFRLRHGFDDVDAFGASVAEATGGKPVFFVETRPIIDQARRSFQLLAGALWVLAGFLATMGILISAQVVLRHSREIQAEDHVLRAIGMTPGELFRLSLLRCSVLAVLGAAIAAVVATLASAAFPLGRARLLDPSLGVSIDERIFVATLGGLVLVIVAVCAVALWWRATRRDDGSVTSATGALLRRAFRGPAASIGMSLALDAGPRRQVPVRSSLASTLLGVAALVTALTIGASLDHLIATPHLYGWAWDVTVTQEGGIDAPAVRAVPGVGQAAEGVTGLGGSILINGRGVAATAIDPAGDLAPPVLDGRLPRAAGEMALGVRSLRAAGLHLGDTVTTSITGLVDTARFEVVGTVVLPFAGDTTSLGEGALLTTDGFHRLDGDIRLDTAFVRFAPGADPAAATSALRARFPDAEVAGAQQPNTVVDFGQVTDIPLISAGIVGLLAAGTLAHVLFSSIQSRRRDFAVVKAIGGRRLQVIASVGWQALIIMGAALTLGVPLGFIAGRWLWLLLGRSFGFVAVPILPPLTVIVVIVGALALGALVAALPAHRAAHTRPAKVLRTA